MKQSIFNYKDRVHKSLIKNIPRHKKYCHVLPSLKGDMVELGDGRIYCETEGNEKATIVLINGGPGATHHYFHPHFSKASSFSKIIYYDQRGCGQSDYRKNSNYSIYQTVEDLDRLRSKLGIKDWIVLGHSFGGLIAQLYALCFPKRTKGLILVAATPGFETGSNRWNLFLSKSELNRINIINNNNDIPEHTKDFNKNINGNWKNNFFFLPSQKRLCMREYEWANDNDYPSLMDASAEKVNLRGSFKLFRIPSLLIEGRWDTVWNEDKAGQMYLNHPNSTLHIFNSSGHYPFEDESNRFFLLLEKFIKTITY